MAKEKDTIKQLLARYISGTINRSDLDTLLDYISLNRNDKEVDAFMEELLEKREMSQEDFVDSEDLYRRITEHSKFRNPINRVPKRNLYWISSVAAVLLLVGISFLFFWYLPKEEISDDSRFSVNSTTTQSVDQEKRAILRLADGTIIDLDSASSGLLATQGNMQITLKGTELHYEGSDLDDQGNAALNTIITPKGRQYQLVLPDGSKIWLNTATTLTYPVRFKGDVRIVEIQGEAYFEVEKSEKWPFIVKTTTQQIEVLGTHFNVSAYEDDLTTKTTLVEGKVQITLPSKEVNRSSDQQKKYPQSIMLAPGEQGITSRENQRIEVQSVDTEEIISWKQNLFVFNNEEIKEIMKKVSRWYDIEVDYQDGMEGKRIGGAIPRFENIEKLMDALKATGLLNYKMEGGRIVIMK